MTAEELTTALKAAFEQRAMINREIWKLQKQLREVSPDYRDTMAMLVE
jgi:hypothetical protein